MTIKNEWYLVSSHGAILFYVAANPDCTVRDVAAGVNIALWIPAEAIPLRPALDSDWALVPSQVTPGLLVWHT